MVRAKFIVTGSEPVRGDNATLIILEPVIDGSVENDAFFEATPAGRIEMYIKNSVAAAEFEVGKSYYIDFIPAE